MTLGIYLQQDDPGFTVHAGSLEAGLTCDECGWRVWFQSKPLFEIARKAAEHGRQHGPEAGLTANSGDGEGR